ncbi:YbaB/EbfC family nucleoid-associated protein [Nocardia sp. NPDC019395]|uniref:YbaB/EbfC family nucleoid-associated protein n=1 Tax=Nocardia sp. NPDC019395 TaxID=3154686 RepID=UPI0033C8977C
MTSQQSAAEAAAIESYQRQMKLVAQLQQERARLTATASVRDKKVTVTVNANSVVIKTEFADDIAELSYGEIAEAMTEAAQKASEAVNRRAQELAQPLLGERAERPKLSDMFEGMPEFEMPVAPEVSSAAPGSAEREAFDAQVENTAAEEPEMTFTDVEQREKSSGRSAEVTESTW